MERWEETWKILNKIHKKKKKSCLSQKEMWIRENHYMDNTAALGEEEN